MNSIENAFIDLLDYLGKYTLLPACLTAIGECTAVFAIACMIMSLFFRKGKADGVRTFTRMLSVITLVFSIILIISFLGVAVLLFIGAGAGGGTYHLMQPFYSLYYAFIAEIICFGLPVSVLEYMTVAVIGITLAFYAVMFLVPSVLGFISFTVVRSAVRKSDAAKAKRKETVQPPLHSVRQYTRYPVNDTPQTYGAPLAPMPEEEPVQPVSEPEEESVQPVSEPEEEPAQPVSEPEEEPAQPVSEPEEEPAQPVSEPEEEPAQPVSEPEEEPAQPVSEPEEEPAQPAEFVPLFCMKCGTPLNGSDFCHNCGLKAGAIPDSFCTSCGARIMPGSAFCTRCGKKL